MIVGIVRTREPLIRLTIRGFGRRQQEIEAVVDTGYTGWLTLPPDVIAALNLRWQTFRARYLGGWKCERFRRLSSEGRVGSPFPPRFRG
jgi:predicted aspartyl protease